MDSRTARVGGNISQRGYREIVPSQRPYRRGAEGIGETSGLSCEKETDPGVADPFRESAVRARGWESAVAADFKAYHWRRGSVEKGSRIGARRGPRDQTEGVLAAGPSSTEHRGEAVQREREREIGGRVGELGFGGMVLNLAQVSGSRDVHLSRIH